MILRFMVWKMRLSTPSIALQIIQNIEKQLIQRIVLAYRGT